MVQTIISVSELAAHLTDRDWRVVDARFALADPSQGRKDYLSGHIPGAVYAHLDEDLSSPVVKGVTGRHPLPSVEAASATFSHLGIEEGIQVVAYDDLGGALAAARVWWLLRWLGHTAVAVLDGGWQAWQKANLPQREGHEMVEPGNFIPHERPELIISSSEVNRMRQDATCLVVDARAPDRFRGENETIDPVAGHIPGAVSLPYAGNLKPNGAFRPLDRLRQRYERVCGEIPADKVGFYCGSGVTAAHNVLAMMAAGLGEARLYAGSWSEWITDPNRPIGR